MRFPAALLIVFWFTVGVQAQGIEAEPPLFEERVGAPRRHAKVVVVVDASGSMQGPRLAQAVEQALEIVGAPTDGLDVAVITFNDTATWLVPDEDDPWYHLPDGDAVTLLRSALTAIRGRGNTNPGPALVEALNSGADTVVLLTDGDFSTDPTAAVQEAQADGGPQLVLFAIGSNQSGHQTLQRLAEATGALVWEEDEPEKGFNARPPPQPVQPRGRSGWR